VDNKTLYQYYCKDCNCKRQGLLDSPAIGIGGWQWNCPECNGTIDSYEVEIDLKCEIFVLDK